MAAISTINARDNSYQEILTSAQTFTAAWVDLGSYAIDVRDIETLGLSVQVTVGTSTGMQFKAVGISTADTTAVEYELPSKVVAATKVSAVPLVYELSAATQNIMLDFPVNDLVNYVVIRVKDAAGGTGTVDSARITHKLKI